MAIALSACGGGDDDGGGSADTDINAPDGNVGSVDAAPNTPSAHSAIHLSTDAWSIAPGAAAPTRFTPGDDLLRTRRLGNGGPNR